MSDAAEPQGLSGIEQLRLSLGEGAEPSGIGATLGFRLVELDEGRVTFEGSPGREVYNPMGTVHGGYAATLLDSAMGCAVHSRLRPGQGFTTLELKVAFHRAMTADTGLVRAEGWVVTLGRRTAFAEARIVNAEGRLHASASSTLLVFER
jgi:uncharacterized protein (TIGR00369 family)